jgi:hypothetical protein
LRRDPEFFGERELDLFYIGKQLAKSIKMEEALTAAEIDYAVEVDQYIGGFLFKRQRAGAFFYIPPEMIDKARLAAREAGFPDTEIRSHQDPA